MYFRILHDEATKAISYLLADLDASSAVLIDPRSDDLPLLRAMLHERNLQLHWILLTHEHASQEPDETDALLGLGAPCIDHQSSISEVISFGYEHLRVIATPGHTPECRSFMWRDRLFCGDLLTVNLCRHQPNPALPKAMWESVNEKIFTLPAETLLFGSHAERARSVSTVFEQRRWHPWFSGASRDEFLARVLSSRAESDRRKELAAR